MRTSYIIGSGTLAVTYIVLITLASVLVVPRPLPLVPLSSAVVYEKGGSWSSIAVFRFSFNFFTISLPVEAPSSRALCARQGSWSNTNDNEHQVQ